MNINLDVYRTFKETLEMLEKKNREKNVKNASKLVHNLLNDNIDLLF